MKTTTILILIALSFVSCTKDTIVDLKKTYQSASHKIQYNIQMSKDSIMFLDFGVLRIRNNEVIFSEKRNINFQQKNFQPSVLKAILSKSHTGVNIIKNDELKAVCTTIKEMISLDNIEMTSFEKTGAHIILSVIREQISRNIIASGKEIKLKNMMMTRSANLQTPIENSSVQTVYNSPIYEGYSRGISSFALNSDIIVNIPVLREEIQTDLLVHGDLSIDAQIFDKALEATNSEQIILSDLLFKIETYANANFAVEAVDDEKQITSALGWWPRGHSHGCCGNYNGPCLFWHPICYIHDKICKKCSPRWLCLPGCVAEKQLVSFPDEPLKEDSDKRIFTFLEDVVL